MSDTLTIDRKTIEGLAEHWYSMAQLHWDDARTSTNNGSNRFHTGLAVAQEQCAFQLRQELLGMGYEEEQAAATIRA